MPSNHARKPAAAASAAEGSAASAAAGLAPAPHAAAPELPAPVALAAAARALSAAMCNCSGPTRFGRADSAQCSCRPAVAVAIGRRQRASGCQSQRCMPTFKPSTTPAFAGAAHCPLAALTAAECQRHPVFVPLSPPLTRPGRPSPKNASSAAYALWSRLSGRASQLPMRMWLGLGTLTRRTSAARPG
jgi:hypothetical protein